MQPRIFLIVSALLLSACGENPATPRQSKANRDLQGRRGRQDLQARQAPPGRLEQAGWPFASPSRNVAPPAQSRAEEMNGFSIPTPSIRGAPAPSRKIIELLSVHSGRVFRSGSSSPASRNERRVASMASAAAWRFQVLPESKHAEREKTARNLALNGPSPLL
jgi:hypothetical protein